MFAHPGGPLTFAGIAAARGLPGANTAALCVVVLAPSVAVSSRCGSDQLPLRLIALRDA